MASCESGTGNDALEGNQESDALFLCLSNNTLLQHMHMDHIASSHFQKRAVKDVVATRARRSEMGQVCGYHSSFNSCICVFCFAVCPEGLWRGPFVLEPA